MLRSLTQRLLSPSVLANPLTAAVIAPRTEHTLFEQWGARQHEGWFRAKATLLGAREVWVHPARRFDLRVDSIDRRPKPASKNGQTPATTINLTRMGAGESVIESAYVALKHDPNPRIDLTHSSRQLFGHNYHGGAETEVMFLSLPVTLAIAPLLVTEIKLRSAFERRIGMSCHSYALLQTLHDQLDADTRHALKEALKRMWREDTKREPLISFDRAKELLSSCTLYTHGDNTGDVTLYWIDPEGDRIAEGHVSINRPAPFALQKRKVSMFNSVFYDGEARELLELNVPTYKR